MPQLRIIQPKTTNALASAALGDLGCDDYGVVVLWGARSWGAHERGTIRIPHSDGTIELRIAYDEREAPYVCDDSGSELDDMLVSLADEKDYLACAWAKVAEGSPLVGVGIDLASTYDFGEHPASDRFVRLMFTAREHELAPQLASNDQPLAYATAFAAKEASFKAMARPLRTWYRAHDDELSFEVRHFALDTPSTTRGDARNGAAQAAMDRMGIKRVTLQHAEVAGMALVVATAIGYGQSDGGSR